jgi:hypothetical protein
MTTRQLLSSADLEDFGAADRTGALSRWPSIFHRDLFCILDFALGLAFHAVASSHG